MPKRAEAPPVNQAAKGTLSIFDQADIMPFKVARSVGGGANAGTTLIKVSGIVTEVKEDAINGKAGKVPVTKLRIVADSVIQNGAQDVVVTSFPGEEVLFPSFQLDEPAMAEDSNANKFRSKQRALQLDPMCQTVYKTGALFTNFYKTDKSNGGQEGPSVASQAAVGLRVEVVGVCANFKENNAYVNASRITADIASAPPPHRVAAAFKTFCELPHVQKQCALNLARASDGFFETSGMDESKEAQAKACQGFWRAHIRETADRLEIMAQGKSDETHSALMAHAARIRATPAEKLAAGETTLWLKGKYDNDVAPVCVSGWVPWETSHPLQTQLVGGEGVSDLLPSCFCVPKVHTVSVAGKEGSLIDVSFLAAFIFDRDAAIEAIKMGKDTPLIISRGPAAAVQLSMKDMAAKVGTFSPSKVPLVAKEVLPFGEFSAFVKTKNLERGAQVAVNCEFPDGFFLDMPATLVKTSVLVSEGFVKSKLCFDANNYDFDDSVETELEPLNPTIKRARLKTAHFCEISTKSFTFTGLKAELPAGKAIAYRVIYEGVTSDLSKNKDLASDAAKGDAHVELAAGLSEKETRDFLISSCALYAVAV